MTELRGPDSDREAEVRAAYRRLVDVRAQIDRGELPWSALADFFTDDAVYIDPAWGRVEGIEDLRRFFVESMRGLESWTFPEQWTVVEGDRVVSLWLQVMGTDGHGRPVEAPGVSILHYAGDGRFCYELDLLNMAEVNEGIRATGWSPSDEFTMPPRHPDRRIDPPAGRPQPGV